MEECVTIAKVPGLDGAQARDDAASDQEHERAGRTLTEEATVTLLRGLGFEISEAK